MGAPKGNQFWKLRSKHGREKLFAEPQALWEACEEYFNWVDAHPYYKIEQAKQPTVQKGVEGYVHNHLAKIPGARPYTIQGLCIYLGVNTVYFNQFEKQIEGKTDDTSKEYSQICTRVREIIYHNKIEGAMVGAFNPSIVARDLQLKDHSEVELTPAGTVVRIGGKKMDDE